MIKYDEEGLANCPKCGSYVAEIDSRCGSCGVILSSLPRDIDNRDFVNLEHDKDPQKWHESETCSGLSYCPVCGKEL